MRVLLGTAGTVTHSAVILKKINNGTKKALSEKMRHGCMRQR